jgi:hypothetical protein
MPAATNAIPNHASNPPTRSPSNFPVNSVNMKVTELVIGTAKERSGSTGVVLKAGFAEPMTLPRLLYLTCFTKCIVIYCRPTQVND